MDERDTTYTTFKLQVSIHAMAVKHGGKFIDTFLKGEELRLYNFTMYTCLYPFDILLVTPILVYLRLDL